MKIATITALKSVRLPNKKQLLKYAAMAVIGMAVFTQVSQANAKTVVIDVRTPEEFQVGHPDGAINISHSEIAQKIGSKGVDKSDTIKLYSRSGNRAEQAKSALQAAGYTNVQVDQQK